MKLDEEYTVQRISTQAENYLPDEVCGPRYELQVVNGLLLSPQVSITDESGTEVEITFDSEKAVYTEQTIIPSIENEEEEAAINIAEGYCKYMIGATNSLSSFFDSDTDIYRTIRQNESWMQQSYTGFCFEDETISDYYRYTDDLFSARISLSLNVTRNNGTIKKYTLDSNFFFRKQKTGGYLAVEMTNLDIQQPISEVRLIYRNDSETLQDEFVRADSRKLAAPIVTAPEGESFSGWAKEITDETGKTSRVLLFVPDNNGEIALPDGYVLEPMILYPVFENRNTEDKGE